jgi:hypothetical protein
VARNEAQPLVEAVRIGSALVRRELDKAATPRTALRNSPFEHLPAESGAPMHLRDANGLNLSPAGPHPGNPRDKRDLQCPDYRFAFHRDDEKLIGISLYGLERDRIFGFQGHSRVFTLPPELIVGKKANDGREIGLLGCSEGNL